MHYLHGGLQGWGETLYAALRARLPLQVLQEVVEDKQYLLHLPGVN